MNFLLRWINILLLGLVGVVIAMSAMAESIRIGSTTAERVLWDKRPIVVHIQRNHERIIHFPDDIRYWLPDQLQRKVTVLAANGVLYIRALEPFSRSRIQVQGLQSQQIYLLDVMADDTASVADELIVMTAESVINQAKDKTQKIVGQDWRVRLSRYAAQQLYAPERLLKGDSAIERIPVASQAIPLIRGGVIEATPIASWQGGGLTVTAVRLQNKQTHPLVLQFPPSGGGNSVNLNKRLRGRWLTATLQHKWLGALGQKDDTTTLYLVSAQSFVESTGFVNLNAGLEEDNADG
ncbi:TIGR03749 family integrating conjugative element protein [SAR92 clade bacterium H455]|uniref:TIGR03749 family integrating conjugative element protein n=1 Tax=SAR92 clade bacterium H455 TaxID=2974818 RepID=A0ABY5TPR6_9GAMM|nr:TIGR03749 family integrating conjugative element protein [SAR92 clade bacterium H455]